MLFIYTTVLFFFEAVKLLVGRNVAALERKHSRAAKEADSLMRAVTFKEGNSSQLDPYQSARKMFALGQLVQKQDRLERRYESWQGALDRVTRLVGGLRGWKGRTLPYTFGVVDVVGILVLIDFLGFSDVVGPRKVVELIASLVSGR
jgi:hypothetical protein